MGVRKRTCTKCEIAKPLTEEFYYKINGRFRNECQECNKIYRNENATEIKKYQKQYKQDNKDKINSLNQKRRARKNNLPNTLNSESWERTLSHFNHECAYCGMTEAEHMESNNQLLHQDHIIPLSKQGGYEKYNIAPCCRSCNSSKGTKDFRDWYPEQDFYTEERSRKLVRFIFAHWKE